MARPQWLRRQRIRLAERLGAGLNATSLLLFVLLS